jgi:DNA (cytosine-5)-methyltransferase 1
MKKAQRKTQISIFDKLSVVLFAGGGGADTGISCMTGRPVDIAINHDIDAIRMHKTNHPYTMHLQEDIFAVDPAEVCVGREVGTLWASPDCTHFSKAKGAKPVKKEIRGLSWVVLKWALSVHPEKIFMENVEEIQTWGPCIETEKGLQPDPSRSGETYKGFVAMLTTGIEPGHPALLEACEFLKISPNGTEAKKLIDGLGYNFGSKVLCAADYGVPTIRKRWFAVFSCDGQPIRFPEPTHSKNGEKGLKKWRSAAEIIDWTLPCPSIFDNKQSIKKKYGLSAVRPLADNTLKRCIRGVDKFTIKSGKPFIVSVNHEGDEFRGQSINEPYSTITGKLGTGVVNPILSPFHMYNHQNAAGTDMREPMNTATSTGSQQLIAPSLMAIGQTGGGDRIYGADHPVNTQVSKAETCLVAPLLIQYHQEQTEAVRGQSIDDPIMTIDGANRYGLVSAQLTEYFGKAQPLDVSGPLHTVTSRDREALTVAHIQKYYDGGYAGCGSEAIDPLGTVTSRDHNALCLSHIVKFKGTNIGQGLTAPLQTITAASGGGSYGTVYTTVERYSTNLNLRQWPEVRLLLNQYCGYSLADNDIILIWIDGVAYYIADIGLRMLTPRELFTAMGFPLDYIIDRDYTGKEYSKTAQVARCGNAVCPPVAGALIKANLQDLALPKYIEKMSELWEAVGM